MIANRSADRQDNKLQIDLALGIMIVIINCLKVKPQRGDIMVKKR